MYIPTFWRATVARFQPSFTLSRACLYVEVGNYSTHLDNHLLTVLHSWLKHHILIIVV